jgi:hypothetical protein
VTSYTRYRRYPYPSSDREAANGAVHSEALARAVALDLDTLDAGWANGAIRTSKILTMSADSLALSSGGPYAVNFNTVNTTKGSAALIADGLGLTVGSGAEGWYYVTCTARLQPTGTVTVNAKFEMRLQHMRTNSGGVLTLRPNGERYKFTYYATTTAALDSEVGGLFRLQVGDRIWMRYAHTNTGSTAQIKAANSVFSAVRVSPL